MNKIQTICTWNVWGIPFASPRLFNRQNQWRRFIDEQIDVKDDNSFRVVCVQEAWRWRSGPLSCIFDILGQYGESKSWFICIVHFLVQFLVQLLSVTLGLLISSKVTYDAKNGLLRPSDNSKKNSMVHAVGINETSDRSLTLLDSGLMILSNRPPTISGFEPYETREHSKSTVTKRRSFLGLIGRLALLFERLATKGILWSYYEDSANSSGSLVITTHMVAGPRTSEVLSIKADACDQLCELVLALRRRFESRTSEFEIFVCGDFNLRPDIPADLKLLKQLCSRCSLRCLGPPWSTLPEHNTHVLGFQCDFIFFSEKKRDDGVFKTTICRPPDSPLLSDHNLILTRRQSGASIS